MEWQEIAGNWMLIPPRPVGIVHFLGGAFFAAAPQVTYRRILERLGEAGYLIVATPFVNTFDHRAMAETVHRNFDRGLYRLESGGLAGPKLPIFGLGHSMGCKLHLLIGSLFEGPRAGNMLMAFNNYSSRASIPLLDQVATFSQQASELVNQQMNAQLPPPVTSQLSGLFSSFTNTLSTAIPGLPSRADWEFTPTPAETLDLVAARYSVKANLLVKFRNDNLDETRSLWEVLQPLHGADSAIARLTGNHLTPLGPDVKWQAGNVFTPVDAIAQRVRQEVYRDLEALEDQLLNWMQAKGNR
jgi:hypothetical protein